LKQLRESDEVGKDLSKQAVYPVNIRYKRPGAHAGGLMAGFSKGNLHNISRIIGKILCIG
jgi:hypothetical protein